MVFWLGLNGEEGGVIVDFPIRKEKKI